MMKMVATIPGISALPSWPISVLMEMPTMAMDWAAAMDIRSGLRPRRSMKKTQAPVANMKSTATPVDKRREASSGRPTLLWRTSGK